MIVKATKFYEKLENETSDLLRCSIMFSVLAFCMGSSSLGLGQLVIIHFP